MSGIVTRMDQLVAELAAGADLTDLQQRYADIPEALFRMATEGKYSSREKQILVQMVVMQDRVARQEMSGHDADVQIGQLLGSHFLPSK